ncbi:MAG: low temperature requirement protein A [Phormidesmis sp.]
MARREWWQKPSLRTDEEEGRDRKVGWLELFFDLYFVVTIAELAHNLAGHVSWVGLGQFVFLFLPVWWIWIGATYYIERFETDGIEHRLIVFGQMIPIAGLAVFAHHGMGETSVGYALSYALCRLLHTFLWWRGGRYDRQFRPVAKRFVLGFSISVGLFCLSVFMPPPVRFWLWGVGLFIDFVTPVLTLKQQTALPRLSTSKLPERYRLFMIIVLGESVVGVVSGLAAQEKFSVSIAIAAILGITLAFGLWWIYFDFVGRRPPKPNIVSALCWSYLHLPLAIAITATGAGILNVIADEDGLMNYSVGLLIAGAVGATLVTIGLIETVLSRDSDEPTHPRLSPGLKFAGGAIALFIGLVSNGFNIAVLEALLLIPISVQMVYGLYVWFTQDLEKATSAG